MLYREIIAVCSEIHTKHINAMCGQRNCAKYVEFYSKNKFQKIVHLVGFIIRSQ